MSLERFTYELVKHGPRSAVTVWPSPYRVARCLLLKNAKICFKKGKWFDFTIETSIDFKKGQILNKF